MAISFNTEFYLEQKLAQLQADGETGFESTADVAAAFEAAGLTAEAHYEQYGLVEGLNPNEEFDTNVYLSQKLAQLQANGEEFATVEDVIAAFAAAGLSPLEHYNQYGAAEALSPNANFNVQAYLEDKLAQLQADGVEGFETTADVLAAFQAAGLTPLDHFKQFGEAEGLVAKPLPTDGSELTEALNNLQAANTAKADFLASLDLDDDPETATTEDDVAAKLELADDALAAARLDESDRALNARILDREDDVAAAQAAIDSVEGLAEAVETLEVALEELTVAEDAQADAQASVDGAQVTFQGRNEGSVVDYIGYEVSVNGELVIEDDNGQLVITEAGEEIAGIAALLEAHQALQAADAALVDAQEAVEAAQLEVAELDVTEDAAEAQEAVAEAAAANDAAQATLAAAIETRDEAQIALDSAVEAEGTADADVASAQTRVADAVTAEDDAETALATAQGELDTDQATLSDAEDAQELTAIAVQSATDDVATATTELETAQGVETQALADLATAEARQAAFPDLAAAYQNAAADYAVVQDTVTSEALIAAYGDLTEFDATAFPAETNAADIFAADAATDAEIIEQTNNTLPAAITAAEDARDDAILARDAAETTLANAQDALATAEANNLAAIAVVDAAQADVTASTAVRDQAAADLDLAIAERVAANQALVAAQDAQGEAQQATADAQTALDEAQVVVDTAEGEAVVTAQALADAQAELSAETGNRYDALLAARDALEAAQEDLVVREELIAEQEEAQALADTLEALNADIDTAEAAFEELGFELPVSVEGEVSATAANDILLFSGEDAIISDFGAEGEDRLFFGEGFTLVALEEDQTINSRVGNSTELEIFWQQDGDNLVLFVENEAFAGNATNTADITTITLEGISADDITSFENGYLTAGTVVEVA